MDFRYNEEQLAAETLRRFIARDYGSSGREFASHLGYSAEAWAQYADLGL
jgi:hypothetical protein